MEKKAESGIILTLLLIGILTSAFSVQPVRASGTIYIRADGSVDPPGAPIQRDGYLYTFTDNIYESIVVEIDNIIVDGAGYTVQGTGAYASEGIDLTRRNNVTIMNMEIKTFYYGISLWHSSDSNITGNNITANSYDGIYLAYSSNNNITGNNITANEVVGIWLIFSSSNNRITRNNITNNALGVSLEQSSDNNIIYHNNFIDNTLQASIYFSYNNAWDDGYPSGGNYWSNYIGVDVKSGPNQDKPGSDEIGDTPHVIDASNRDRYPLMNPWAPARPPIASFTYSPTFPYLGQAVAFDASGSLDPDGIVVSCTWDFGDGLTGTDFATTHTYESAGTFPVTLTVTDDQGLTDSLQQTITVDPFPTLTVTKTHINSGSTETVTLELVDADHDGFITQDIPNSMFALIRRTHGTTTFDFPEEYTATKGGWMVTLSSRNDYTVTLT